MAREKLHLGLVDAFGQDWHMYGCPVCTGSWETIKNPEAYINDPDWDIVTFKTSSAEGQPIWKERRKAGGGGE